MSQENVEIVVEQFEAVNVVRLQIARRDAPSRVVSLTGLGIRL
jgi:hypothetical protein